MLNVNQRTIELGMLDIRAAIGTVDSEKRTVEVTFSTGAPVLRFDWETGRRYWEVLSLDPKHVRMERLNAGAPVLDTHSGWSVRTQLGVVADGTAKLAGNIGSALLQFSKRADVDSVWKDVVDRVVRNVSVGYATYAVEESIGKDELTVRKAVDWEPYEISMCPMNADMAAQTRSKTHDRFPCVVTTRGASVEDADRGRRLRLAQLSVGRSLKGTL